MNPMEQNELLGEITTTLVAALPAGWQRLIFEYAVVDGRVRVGSGLRMTDGSTVRFQPPGTLAPLFKRLRRGMGEDWHQLDLVIDPPATFHAKFHR